ncbi:transmembrane protein 44 isoform X1 [Tachysurus fulvidraco]|uniref:transmembrane protein 44 isoform X1 n=1 Tax=Tachysurus fulvidraco TaxID=1234273 RepID=UPI001FF05D7D|nr:transmembrane protein 44 isoform X1 [Tachysurus fulvidraco]XP_027027244.2 transmembrane protein 44 isoform X1 [Tachysurus fulvidraco]XP_027027245.2 transmembrane protein 44 isoform X1 [Tachysurus fulvidraco]XP_047660042.1 transmembrane protein 44 isoform X1 [Tachysurus fulvidraco]
MIQSAFSQWCKDVTSHFYSEIKTVGISTAVGFTSASFLVLSYLIGCSRSQFRDAAVWVLYSLIGDLCHLTGAFLSNQTSIQCIMATIMTSLDVVHFISAALPLCWWYYSSTGRRMRMLRRRRRQNAFVVCLLFGMGGYVYADIRVRHVPAVAFGSPTHRKLLNVVVRDQTELLGYVLGLLSFAISWTSRIPLFLKANRGEMSNLTHVSSRAFSAAAGALYASAIMFYEPRLECVLEALPWILSGASWAILDFSILLLSCYRIRYRRRSVGTQDSNSESLLGGFHRVSSVLSHKEKDSRKHISLWKSSTSKMPERKLCRNVQPIRKVCLKKVTITRSDSAENHPIKGTVKVVRVDERYSSGSTTDSSCLSSELEWDFEETPPQWSSQNEDKPQMDAFPLQEWMVDPRTTSNTSSSSTSCFCNSADLEERIVSGSSDTNFQSLSDPVK